MIETSFWHLRYHVGCPLKDLQEFIHDEDGVCDSVAETALSVQFHHLLDNRRVA